MRDAIRGHHLLEECLPMRDAIRGHPDEGRNQRPSEAIRGHQRSSEAIRGHQRACSRSARSCVRRFASHSRAWVE